MANPLPIQPENTDNLQELTKAQVPALESLKAYWQGDDTAVTKLAQVNSLNELESRGGQMLQPNELNQLYPNMPQPFDRPMNRMSADEIFTRAKEKQDLNRISEAGPDSWLNSGLKFGASLVHHAMDPIEFGAGALTGGVLNLAVRGAEGIGLAAVSKFGTKLGYGLTGEAATQYAAKQTVQQLFAREAISGATANLALEPLNVKAAQMQQQNYDASDVLENTAVGSLGFAAGMTALHGVMRFGKSSYLRFLQSKGEDVAASAERVARGQAEAGKQVDISPLVENHIKEVYEPKPLENGNPDIPLKDYQYEPISGNEIKGKELYASTRDVNPDFVSSQKNIIGEDLGDGIYLTDNATTANNTGEMVHKFEMKDNLNLINLDEAIPKDEATKIGSAAESAGLDVPKEGISLKDYITEVKSQIDKGDLPEQSLNKFNDELATRGYDGYIHSNDAVMDFKTPNENVVNLFNDKALEKTGEFTSDPSVRGGLDSERLQEVKNNMLDRKSDLSYDKPATDYHNDPVNEPSDLRLKETELDREYETAKQGLAEMQKSSDVSPEIKSQIEDLTRVEQETDAEKNAIKYLYHCLGG